MTQNRVKDKIVFVNAELCMMDCVDKLSSMAVSPRYCRVWREAFYSKPYIKNLEKDVYLHFVIDLL